MNDYPEDDFEDVDRSRSAVEIAKRVIALHCVIAASHKVSRTDISEWLRTENLYDELSPWERKFMEVEENAQREVSKASWRVEGQVALLWSIQKIDEMDEMTGKCNTKPVVDAMPGLFTSTSDFIETAILRSKAEIEEAYERIYDIHVKVRNVKRTGVPVEYDSAVVQERHYAMNWITGYCGQAWDDITTDT